MARANLAVPLFLLGFAAAFPHYALLARYGLTGLIQARISTTPDGMYPSSIFIFSGLAWLSPFLLPALLLFAAWLLDYYVGFFLDTKTKRSELRRLSAWGALPLAMQSALAGVLLLACGRDCNEFNPLATNAAFFLDAKATDVYWYELARGVELFAVWAVVITGRAIAARYDRSTAAVIIGVGLLYFLAALIRAWLLG